MFGRVWRAVAGAIRAFFASIKNGVGAVFGFFGACFRAVFGFLAFCAKGFFFKVIAPFSKFVSKYVFYIPLRFIAIYIFYIPLRFIAIYIFYIPLKFIGKFVFFIPAKFIGRYIIFIPARFIGKYFIYIPIRFIIWLFIKLCYYLVYVPVKYASKNAYRYFLLPLGLLLLFASKKAGVFCAFVYKKALVPLFRAIYLVFKHTFKGVFIGLKWLSIHVASVAKTVGIFVARTIYRFLLRPLYFALKYSLRALKLACIYICRYVYRFLLRPIFIAFKHIILAIQRAVIAISKFVYRYLLRPLFNIIKRVCRFVRLILKKLAIIIYRFIIRPIYIAFKYMLKFLRFILVKLALLIYNYIIYPLYWLMKTVLTALFKALRIALKSLYRALKAICRALRVVFRALWRAIKLAATKVAKFFKEFARLVYHVVLTIIFLPLITLYYLVATLFTTPVLVFSSMLPSIKSDIKAQKISKLSAAFLNPYYIIGERHSRCAKLTKEALEQNKDSIGLARIKHFSAIITATFWSLILYPINLIVLAL